MEQEFETQVLDVNKEDIIDKLRKLGAKETPEILQKRWVYDLDSCTKSSKGEWIRLRQAGNNKPTITYKNKSGKGVDQTQEIETAVEDFDKTAAILSKLNFQSIYYQENKRMKLVLNEIEFTLDTWPLIPTYLEVEGKNKEKVAEGLALLSLTGKDSGHIGTMTIYDKYNIDLHSYLELRF